MTTTTPKPGRDNDWTEGQVTLTRLRNYASTTVTAYAVTFESQFIGYVIGRDGGWSQQPEEDPTIPVDGPYRFVFGGPSRGNAINNLLFEARQVGLIPEKVRGPKPGDLCRILDGGRVEHVAPCPDGHATGTVTKAGERA